MGNIRAVLWPLFLVSYVCGTRIIEFPAGKSRPWCSFFYLLLLWSIYHFLFYSNVLDRIIKKPLILQFGFWLNHSVTLLSVVLGIYHKDKYRTCLRKITIIDSTLEKIGATEDYQKLYVKILFTVFGWLTYMICTVYAYVLLHGDDKNVIHTLYISFLFQYALCVNSLDDLILINTLRYVEHKFEQLNEFLGKLERDNKHRMKRVWDHYVLLSCQARYPKFPGNEYATWIGIHLHLELCKISRLINSIFGIQITLKMGVYFVYITVGFREIFNALLIPNYNKRIIFFVIMYIIFLVLNILRLFTINYMCEKVSNKANTTRHIINKISSTSNVVVHENVSQFLLQISLTPLKFYGLGLFTLGLKFFYEFSNSILTVIVILIQSYTEA